MKTGYRSANQTKILWWVLQKTENEYRKHHFFLQTKQALRSSWLVQTLDNRTIFIPFFFNKIFGFINKQINK